jgi:hypothetical protein
MQCPKCGIENPPSADMCDCGYSFAKGTYASDSAVATATAANEKKRHGCLTALLVLMLVANSATALMYLLGGSALRTATPNVPASMFPVLALIGFFNLACAIALFRWKKWGFWGFCVSSVVALAVNVSIGVGPGSIFGLIGIAVLYGVLRIGGVRDGWSQLE